MSAFPKLLARVHTSAVRDWNTRAADLGLNWRLSSRYESLAPATAGTKQLVRSLFTAAISSTVPARRLLAHAATILPASWTRPIAALWGQATSPGSAIASLPILAPAAKASLLHFAVVFAAGAIVDRVAPDAIHALQMRAPHAMQSRRTHPALAEVSASVTSTTDGLCLLPNPLRFGECGSAHAWAYRALPPADGSAAGGRLRSLDGSKLLYLVYWPPHGGGAAWRAAKVCTDLWCLRCLGRENGNRARAGRCSGYETVRLLQLASSAATTGAEPPGTHQPGSWICADWICANPMQLSRTALHAAGILPSRAPGTETASAAAAENGLVEKGLVLVVAAATAALLLLLLLPLLLLLLRWWLRARRRIESRAEAAAAADQCTADGGDVGPDSGVAGAAAPACADALLYLAAYERPCPAARDLSPHSCRQVHLYLPPPALRQESRPLHSPRRSRSSRRCSGRCSRWFARTRTSSRGCTRSRPSTRLTSGSSDRTRSARGASAAALAATRSMRTLRSARRRALHPSPARRRSTRLRRSPISIHQQAGPGAPPVCKLNAQSGGPCVGLE